MKIIDPGHVYELQNLASEEVQTLRFIKKEPVSEGSTELKTVMPGTTSEQVLSVLIDRLTVLNDRLPDDLTAEASSNLTAALTNLNLRTEQRKAANVEGTNAAIPKGEGSAGSSASN